MLDIGYASRDQRASRLRLTSEMAARGQRRKAGEAFGQQAME